MDISKIKSFTIPEGKAKSFSINGIQVWKDTQEYSFKAYFSYSSEIESDAGVNMAPPEGARVLIEIENGTTKEIESYNLYLFSVELSLPKGSRYKFTNYEGTIFGNKVTISEPVIGWDTWTTIEGSVNQEFFVDYADSAP